MPSLPTLIVLALYAGSAFLLAMLLFTLRGLRRLRAVPRDAWVVLELRGVVTEVPPHVPVWRRLFARTRLPLSLLGLRRLAARLERDGRVKGVLVRVEELQCGWATADGLRGVIKQLRDAGKRVVVYLPLGGMTREIYVALAAEKIYASPQASLAPLGVASGMSFYRSLLARGGIEAEMLARREYKSAAEAFTRDGYSEPNKQQISALLDTLHGAFVDALARARGLDDAAARALIDTGTFRAREAAARGLIDGVAYDDELPTLLETKPEHFVKAPRYAALTLRPSLLPALMPAGKRVGIVEVRGPIVAEAQTALGRVADARRIIGALRAARAAPFVGAVVLYVDSPGGSALASDLIAREVERLREKKPVVAFFSDTAASGGYYVAAPANEIVAQPLTVTGSIGVIALRFVFERTLAKLGITHEVIRRGARADLMSPYRHWTDDERALLDSEIDGFYNDFVAIVARGRNKPAEQIEPLARGRVYSGRDAHAAGLVDRLGGLDAAVARAAELAKLSAPHEPVVIRPPRELPDPPEPPAALQPLVARLGGSAGMLNLALSAGRERLFAYDDALGDGGE